MNAILVYRHGLHLYSTPAQHTQSISSIRFHELSSRGAEPVLAKSPLTTLANYAQYRPPRDLVSHLENTIDMQKLD